MDPLLIFFRIVHVGAAMIWFGGAIVTSFFLQPTAKALGPAGGPFLDHLMNRRKMGVVFPILAALTVLAGAALYWINSDGLQWTWITSSTGLAFTIGGLAAVGAFVGGMLLIGPSMATYAEVRSEMAAGGGVPTAEQSARMAGADRKLQLAGRIDMPLLILAALTMAVARYL